MDEVRERDVAGVGDEQEADERGHALGGVSQAETGPGRPSQSADSPAWGLSSPIPTSTNRTMPSTMR